MVKRAQARGSSELPFQAIIEHLPVVVYVDSRGEPVPRTIYISPTVKDVLGHPPELFLEPGLRWQRTVHHDDIAEMRAEFDRSTKTGLPYEMVYRFVHPDGHDVWVRDRATPYTDPVTGEGRWMGTLEDITAEVEAKAAEEVSAVRYASLLENLPAVVYEMDPDDDRRTRYVNRKIEELLGYTMEEWLDQPDMWTEVLHPDDRERELAAHDLASKNGAPWQREYRLIGADGHVVWVRDQAALLRGPEGDPTHWQGVMVDITAEKEADLALTGAHEELEFRVLARTAALAEANELMGIEIAERRRAEEERVRAESHLGYLVHNLPAVIYLWQIRENPDGSWNTFVGDHIAPMLGYTPEEWNDGGWRHRVHPHDIEAVEEAAQHSIETGEPFQLQYRYLAKDGRVVWVMDHATLSKRTHEGEPLLFEGVMLDITETKEAERKAAAAEDRFADIVERGPVVTYAYSAAAGDPSTITLDYVSPQIQDLLGVSPDGWERDPMLWFRMVHPDDRDEVLRSSRVTWRTGESWASEYRVIRTDGGISWVADRGACVALDGSGHRRFVGVIGDVTERREDELELERTVEELRDHVAHSPAMLWTELWDPATGLSRYEYVSGNTEDLIGYTPEELAQEGEHFTRLLHPDDKERVMANVGDGSGVWTDTFRLIHRDGSVRWMQGHGQRSTPPGVAPERWHGITIDVTPHMSDSADSSESTPATNERGR